jgi:hypothetical protein
MIAVYTTALWLGRGRDQGVKCEAACRVSGLVGVDDSRTSGTAPLEVLGLTELAFSDVMELKMKRAWMVITDVCAVKNGRDE